MAKMPMKMKMNPGKAPSGKSFEKSGMDNDKGMKEGSAKDMKADKSQMSKWDKMKGKKV